MENYFIKYDDVKNNIMVNYVSLDDLNVRALAIENPELFFRTYNTPLIIDEFQYAPIYYHILK